ncbi:MAG: adenylate/guanylate cyclase domain-containing protein [Betaproteobacteria bacterium]
MARDHRRLAAIVSFDVAGYSRLMGIDDSGTLAALKAHRRELIDLKVAEHDGRIVKTMGDGLLVEFSSVVDAVRCAVEVQRGMAERNEDVPPDRRLAFRIGINVGDIIIDGDDIHGDGVNVAARLQALAEPGGICVSKVVRDQVLDKLSFTFEDLGAQQVKNIARPVEVYRVELESGSSKIASHSPSASLWRKLGSHRLLAVGTLALVVASLGTWFWLKPTGSESMTAAPLLSVAVLPFTAPASPAEQQFADAFTRALTAGLGRTLHIGSSVVSQGALSTDKTKAGDTRAIGRELKVRYLAEGEIRRNGNLLVVAARLVDTGGATQVWSGRFEVRDAELTADPSALVVRVTSQIRSALYDAETRRVDRQPVRRDSPAELAFRARAIWGKETSLASALDAQKLYDEALRLDPNFAPAMYGRAEMIVEQLDMGPNPDHKRLAHEADDLTRRALALAGDDAFAWRVRAEALRLQYRWDAALDANATAIKLDPSRSSTLGTRALYMIWTGRPAEALPLTVKALEINPGDRGFELRVACRAYLSLRQYDEAIAACEKSAVEDDYWNVNAYLAAAYAQKGELAKAAAAGVQVLKRQPKLTIKWYKDLILQVSDNAAYRQESDEQLFAGLRKAGIPEK